MAKKILTTISFRGERKLWIEFVYQTRKQGHKNTWEVLEQLIKKYLK